MKEKQIDEMARVVNENIRETVSMRKVYEVLYDAGYRKYRKGRWIQTPPSYCSCSECQTEGSPRWKCCPVCMAVMEVDV